MGQSDLEFQTDTTARIRAARGGDRAAVDRLLTDHLSYVRRIAALNMGQRLAEIAEIDDLVQDALLSALRSMEDLPCASRGSFRGWLARVVQNRARDAARRSRTRKRDPGNVTPLAEVESHVLCMSLGVTPPSPSQAALGHELESRLEESLLGLGDNERRIVVMRRLEERSFDEIAEELGLAGAASARSLLTRTLAKLSDQL